MRDRKPTKRPPTGTAARAVPIVCEADLIVARNAARACATARGFGHADQIKVATAVSEVGRNILRYASQGTIVISELTAPRAGVRIQATDRGPGIPHLDAVLRGEYTSDTGMGLGIRGCKRLMDEFSITTDDTGTTVRMVKYVD